MISDTLSRRRLLEAAGGITFLALVPNGRGAFAAILDVSRHRSGLAAPLPLFTALPYIQPGPNASVLVENNESLVLAWQTNLLPARFEVMLKDGDHNYPALVPERTERFSGDPSDGEGRFNYATTFRNLALGKRYQYRVTMNGATLAEGFFTTRKKRGQKTRFVSFGDNSFGEVSDRMIAHQAYLARPDFVMNTGDNVYEGGLDNEYARYFFPVYNADVAGPRVGAPLLRSVPFYTVIANHDVHDKDANKHPVADFTLNPDSLAYYTAMHLPLNGPDPVQKTPAVGDPKAIAVFEKAAGGRFPRMANYSFDYGDAHFLCLDANVYVDPTDARLQDWIASDLSKTDAAWKFVVYHHPAFNVGNDHYAEQHMRVLSPFLEKGGVDIALHGHEHTYQRTMPLTFAPGDISAARKIGEKKRLVPGMFTVDRVFDGAKNTRACGITYITTGAGGKHLYDPEQNEKPESWRHPEDGNVDYVVRMITDRHSLSVFDMTAETLELRQIDQWGAEIDRCRWTKK